MLRLSILAVDQNAGLAENRALYRELARFDDLDVTLVAPTAWKDSFGSYQFEKEKSSLPVVASPTIFKGHHHRVLFPFLPRYVWQFKPDILFVNAEPENFLAAEGVVLRSIIARKTQLVLVSWRNIDYGAWVYPYRLSFLYFLSQKLVVRAKAACVAHSENAREIIRGIGIREIAMIPPGEVVGDESAGNIARSGTDFSIGYVGRLSEQKGIADLLQAVATLNFSWRLVVVGEGDERGRLEELARTLGISSRVHWKGGLRKREVNELYETMDVLVLPSKTSRYWKEQFGRVLIEAMAEGVAVIGSNSGEIPNVIGDAGIVFPEGDIAALANGLRLLQQDEKLRKEFAIKGIQRVKSRFAVVSVAARYREFFQHLVLAKGQED